MYQQPEIDYQKLNRIGGWMIFLILRMLVSAVMAGVSIYFAPSLGYTPFIPLFIAIVAAALTAILLMLRKKKAFRYAYFVFSALCLLDYFFAQDAAGFVACMAVEACWILYLLLSVRVKLVLGLLQPPDESAERPQNG